MGKKVIVGPMNKGLRKDVEAFNIDDDSFPNLINAYQWRGKIKRKRGTAFLARLQRYFNSAVSSYGSISSFGLSSGNGNLLTGFGLEVNGNIVPTTITFTNSGSVYTDPNADGKLSRDGTPTTTNTINYATGQIFLNGAGGSAITNATFRYLPDLPTMGIEDLLLNSNDYPTNLSFDTTYSYVITPTDPAEAYDVSFYKNPTSGTSDPSYVQKTNITPTWWNGEDYQQFWTVNYQGAFWATNGVTTPFLSSKVGMQHAPSSSITVVSQTATTLVVTITNCPLIVGDYVFVNEFNSGTPNAADSLNFQTGYVTASSSSSTTPSTRTLTIKFPNASIVTATYSAGMIQYLTNRSDTNKDGIRWYDGDPTTNGAISPILNGRKGWVNFAPPLSENFYSINDLPLGKYYLVGCKMIVPFKDRLVFFAPVVQQSGGVPIYLQDTAVYSQNGTPFYTASFNGNVIKPTTTFNSILVPDNQTATPNAYFGDQTGFGGWIGAGKAQEITTCESNEDVLIIGFPRAQSRFVYTGNDVLPFNFFDINSELGSGSTFSSINMSKGVITRGSRGYIMTSQVGSDRIDEALPDQAFEIRLSDNGAQRVCAQRDYINEWINFTYPSNQQTYKFPNQTLFFNYKDDSWAIFNECYTTYGLFRQQSGYTWSTLPYDSWSEWNDAWDSGESTLFNPDNIAGNQQGFVLKKDEGTSESISLYIQNIVGSVVTSPNHCLNTNDFILIKSAIGTVADEVNNKVFQINVLNENSFTLIPNLLGTGTYFGLGTITRMYLPQIQTKQFPIFWSMASKTRLGVQQYLLTTTAISEITLLIFLSQNANFPYNDMTLGSNGSLVYSTVLYTCPESTNLGLTPANINLNMVTATAQAQTWHRINTSLIGDTVQLGFTLSNAQMQAMTPEGVPKNAFSEIELHGFIIDVSPSMVLA